MKKKLFCFFAITLLSVFSTLFAQGFQPPSEGKAVVYFVRVSSWGAAISFEYFHQDRYIGAFKKKNYMRYECDPGEQLLWASSENKEFITTDLKEGGTYIVIVDIIMGAWKARVGLDPININDKEKFNRAKELIMNKKPIVTPQQKIDAMNIKLKDFIAEKLYMYEEKWKKVYTIKHVSSEMAIPLEYLN